MALQGIGREVQQPPVEIPFDLGQPDIDEAVEVSVKALRLLDLVTDAGAARESLESDYARLAGPGGLNFNGRLYPLVSQAVSLEHIVSVAEGQRREGVDKKHVYGSLWTLGTEADSYSKAQLDAGPDQPEARIAVFSNQPGDFDPILHFRGLPFDDKANKERQEGAYPSTQLDEVQRLVEEFSKQHPQNTITPIGPKDFAMLALMDRIRGKKAENPLDDPASPDFILKRGFARLASSELGRRGSLVGVVYSCGGRLYFADSVGSVCDDDGVGLSLGLVE